MLTHHTTLSHKVKQTLSMIQQYQAKVGKQMHRLKGIREASVVLSDLKKLAPILETERRNIFALHVEGDSTTETEAKKHIKSAAKCLVKVIKCVKTAAKFTKSD